MHYETYDIMNSTTFLLQELSEYCQLFKKVVNDQCLGLQSWEIIMYSVTTTWLLLFIKGIIFKEHCENKSLFQRILRRISKLPLIKSLVNKKLDDTRHQVEKELNKGLEKKIFLQALPKQGWKQEKVLKELDNYLSYGNFAWNKGRVSGAVYHGSDPTVEELLTLVFSKTAFHNPLHPDIFPGIRLMEAEIIRMTCSLFNGDENSCGTVSSGGTESIFLACKAYRDYAKFERGINNPNMVIPITAHAAFDKAADILKIKLKHIALDPKTTKVNVRLMKRAIDKNTIMLVGSAPAFPHGCVDPIVDIAKLGYKYRVPVHVDSCLGGFLVPFMRKAGYDMEPFDFSVTGVTSISADTHKYAYAPKGTSVIMYRNKSYRQYQYSFQPNWPGGIYGTPTLAGSRSGALIATCWSTLTYYGEDFYVESTRKVISTARYIQSRIAEIDGIFIYGQPEVSVIAIGSKKFDIYCLSGALSHKGWNLNILQFPSGFHFCVTLQHTKPGVADEFLIDLRQCTETLMKAPDTKATGSAAIYGMSQSIPDRSLVGELVAAYLDACTSTSFNQTHEDVK